MRVLEAVLGILLMTGTAHASTWYLMAADSNIVGAANAADRMNKGSRLGPIQLTSQGEFLSRQACEPAREKLIESWEQRGVARHGGWRKYGVRTAGGFIRCIPDSDPHLKKSDAGTVGGPILNAYVNVSASRM